MAGYFDSVKTKRRPLEAVPATVTPIHRPHTDGLHPYARAVVDAELARLDACRAAPLGSPPHWDETTYQVACNLIEIANSPWSGYTLSAAHSDIEARAPRDNGFNERHIAAKWASAESKVGAAGRPEPIPGQQYEIPSVTTLNIEADVRDLDEAEEDAFWASRPILAHLHTYARARLVSPWAVLGAALARIVTVTPHQVCLPPIVGGKASLNMFVGLVGPSGSGKGAAEAVAAEALAIGYIVTHNVGSGEGIAHGYKRRVKNDLEWLDDDHAVCFSVPEIDSLAAQGDRKGATLMPQLRSGWTGEQLGFGYADPTKRIIVEAHQYRLCLIAGIQPARASCLLDDADGGTPQRFLWMPATDPHAPDVEPEAPTPLAWSPPRTSSLAAVGGIQIKVCETARHTIKEARRARNRGDGTALDGHALLARLKTAAALGVMAGRYEVTDDDWALAEVVQRKSDATRAEVIKTLRAKSAAITHDRAEAEAKRAVHVAETMTEAAIKRACGVLVRRLKKDEWMSKSELRKTLASRDRSHLEDALDRLDAAGRIELDGTLGATGKYRLREDS